MSGANTAVRTNRATRANPTSAPGFRMRRYHASPQSPLGPSIWISLVSSSATDTSAHPDPRIEVRVRDVDDEVHEDEDEGHEEDPALEDGVVAVLDRACEPRPHPGDGEDRLREDRPREQEARLQADDR